MSTSNATRAAPGVSGDGSQEDRLGGAITKSDTELPSGFQLKESAERIRSLIASSATDMLSIGEELILIKGKLDHGEFGFWLRAEFGWTARTAQNFMAAAAAFGSNAKSVSYLPVTTLYRLAAPSASAAREKVIERIGKGDRPPVKEIDSICHEVRERQKQDRVTEKLNSARRQPARSRPIVAPQFDTDAQIRSAREQYAALLAKTNIAEVATEIELLKERVGELKGITAPTTAEQPEPFPELPEFLDRRKK